MQKLKAYIAVALLLVLAPVLVPKEAWHSCSHAEAVSHAMAHATQTEHVEASCDICKIVATPFAPAPAQVMPLVPAMAQVWEILPTQAPASHEAFALPLRGPPTA